MLLVSEPKIAISTLARLHKDFFNDAFSAIYASIHNYYKKHNIMPSLDAMLLESNRNAKLSQALTILANTPVPQVTIEQALEVLESEYTQDLFLSKLDSEILRDITMLDKGELINRVAALALQLEEKVTHSGNIYNADQMSVFLEKENSTLHLVQLGLSNEFDVHSGGLGRGETLMIGGYRGTGKSVICSNIQCNRYIERKVAPYFSLEMKPAEVFRRNLAMLAGVSALDIRNQRLKENEVHKLARTRAKMFNGGLELYDSYTKANTVSEMADFYEFEQKLMESYELHTPMIIIHDAELTTAKLDAQIGRVVSEYGEDMVDTVLLDYINQVKLEGASNIDQYNWTDQMVVSKSFKNTCVKYDVAGISPFQMDKDGRARMSQGILDSCDMAINLNAAKNDRGEGGILFDCVKVRSMSPMKFMPKINWKTLRIDSSTNLTMEDAIAMQAEFVIPIEAAKPKQERKRAPKTENAESASDL